MSDPTSCVLYSFVALELLKNANIAAGMVLPSCQDTGTGMPLALTMAIDQLDISGCATKSAAIVMGKRGQHVLTDGRDEEHLSRGVFKTYTETNLRYSQVAPLDMYAEKNTGTNLPAQVCCALYGPIRARASIGQPDLLKPFPPRLPPLPPHRLTFLARLAASTGFCSWLREAVRPIRRFCSSRPRHC